MARRRKRDDDWVWLVCQLAGLVVLLSLISPQVRQGIAAVGFLALCLVGVALVALIGFVVYRLATRSKRKASSTLDMNCDVLDMDFKVDGKRPQARSDLGEYVVSSNWHQEQRKPQTTAGLIEQLRAIDWFQFEKLVELAYRKLGYTVTRRGGANPDGGIDLVIEKDGQRSAVQCKQWKTWNVGVKAVREFLGALTDTRIQKGIFITLCGYSGEAKQLADKHGIEIINEAGLAQMLEATGAKSDPETISILNDPRKFCPKCESEMVLRTAKKGSGAGKQFWGCSTYPRCNFTMPI